MRAVLTSWGTRGDIEPLAALAVELQKLGAEAMVCAPPDEDFQTLLARAGVRLVPLGAAVRPVVSGTKSSAKPDAFQLAADLVAARFSTLGEVATDADVIVAGGLLPAGARDVADKLGIDYVHAALQVYGLPSPHFPPGVRPGAASSPDENDIEKLWQEDADRVNVLYGQPLNRHRARLGLPPVTNTRDYVFTDRPWLAADPVLCPGQGMTNFDLVQTGAWILPDDRPLPPELTAFLEAGAPPVYVGFGSMAAYTPKDVARVAIEAIRSLDHRVLLGKGWADLAPVDGSADCLAVGEVNQQALFPRVAAVLHHGGAGTTTTAARAGVPQVVVPQIADQPFWAGRVAQLGIGAQHDGPTPTTESLTNALAEVVTPRVRARAAEVADLIRLDGAAVAARLLLERSRR